MRLASSRLREQSIHDREHGPQRSRDILNRMLTGKTSSYSRAPKPQRCCSSPEAKIRKRHALLRESSLCLKERHTRYTQRRKSSCQQVCPCLLLWVVYGLNARLFLGTFKTPQLLELSGIGDRNLLKNFGIETLIDLPGVGENLLDQTYTLIDYVAKEHVKTLGKC